MDQTTFWQAQVMLLSALENDGIDTLWSKVTEFENLQKRNGLFEDRRKRQAKTWLWDRIESGLAQDFKAHLQVSQMLPELQQRVEYGEVAASVAARQILDVFKNHSPIKEIR